MTKCNNPCLAAPDYYRFSQLYYSGPIILPQTAIGRTRSTSASVRDGLATTAGSSQVRVRVCVRAYPTTSLALVGSLSATLAAHRVSGPPGIRASA